MNYPELNIQIAGVNEAGQESGNFLMPSHGDLPWLQDVDANNNQASDVWYDQWHVDYRDVVILDSDNVRFDTDPALEGIQNYNLSVNDLGLAENYDELRDLFLQAASPRSTVALRLVDAASPTDSVGEGVIPAGADWADEWGSFYVEVWVETTNSDTQGLTAMSLDLTFDPTFVSAQSLRFGPAFATTGNGTINNSTGRISGIEASTLRDDIADDAAVLLAHVEFTTVAAPHNAAGHYLQPLAELQFKAENTHVTSVVAASVVEPVAPLNVSLLPVTYDLNDDGRIGFSDLALFSAAFLQNVGANAQTWGSDFDHSGRVDFGDLSLLSANFLRASSDPLPLQYPDNWPDAWIDSSAPLLGTSSASSLSPALVAMAMSEEFSTTSLACDAYVVAELTERLKMARCQPTSAESGLKVVAADEPVEIEYFTGEE